MPHPKRKQLDENDNNITDLTAEIDDGKAADLAAKSDKNNINDRIDESKNMEDMSDDDDRDTVDLIDDSNYSQSDASSDEDDSQYESHDDRRPNNRSKSVTTKQSVKPSAKQSKQAAEQLNSQSTEQSTEHDDEKKYVCSHDGCGKRYTTSSKLSRHMAVHSGTRPHHCSFCNQSFVRADHRNMHEKRKHSAISDADKPFKCTVDACTAAFFSSSNLRRHLASSVHGVRSLPCTISGCTESFAKKNQLKLHISRAHPESLELAFKCAHTPCTEAFATRKLLTKHVHLQHTVKRYVCTDCSQEFNRFLLWKTHCKKSHPKSSGQSNNQSKSESEDPDVIDVTDVKTADSLPSNQSIASPTPRTFICTQPGCTKRYTSQWNLTKHTRTIHEGIREFVCPHCSQAFAYKNNLMNHIQSVHVNASVENAAEPRKRRFSAKRRLLGMPDNQSNSQSNNQLNSQQDEISQSNDQSIIQPDMYESNISTEPQRQPFLFGTEGLMLDGMQLQESAAVDEPQAKRMRMSPPIEENQSESVEVM